MILYSDKYSCKGDIWVSSANPPFDGYDAVLEPRQAAAAMNSAAYTYRRKLERFFKKPDQAVSKEDVAAFLAYKPGMKAEEVCSLEAQVKKIRFRQHVGAVDLRLVANEPEPFPVAQFAFLDHLMNRSDTQNSVTSRLLALLNGQEND